MASTAETPATGALDTSYRDYVGVLHIHTKYSDGAGTYEEIARIANAQGLDYLIVTDHNTLQPLRDGKRGWHGTTLVLVGMEITTDDGHYLTFNATHEVDRHHLSTQQIIDEVSRQGGMGFIAHPFFSRRRWSNWNVTGFTGIEAYNVAHDTLYPNRFRLALYAFTMPMEPFYFSILERPSQPLAKWDELIRQRGHIVGIGSSDAHEFRLLGLRFAPYDVMLRLMRTHFLIPSRTLEEHAIYDALRKGHAYLSTELAAEAKGFSFAADDGRRVLGVMGDDVRWRPDLQLTISLPAPAEVTLLRDGQPIKTVTGRSWHIPVAQPGVYRVEAARHGKPWIFSNPIYVHGGAAHEFTMERGRVVVSPPPSP